LSTASRPVREAHRPQIHGLSSLPSHEQPGATTRDELARYGQAFKDRAVARLLPPESAPLEVVSREVGVSAGTLERWRDDALAKPAVQRVWTAAARLEAVIATAALDETARNAWCREHGVYAQQLAQWRDSATQALAQPEEARATRQQTKHDRQRIKALEREVRRKDKVLAETTALLVLSKKVAAIFDEGEAE
jgi:transposase-like protein